METYSDLIDQNVEACFSEQVGLAYTPTTQCIIATYLFIKW